MRFFSDSDFFKKNLASKNFNLWIQEVNMQVLTRILEIHLVIDLVIVEY